MITIKDIIIDQQTGVNSTSLLSKPYEIINRKYSVYNNNVEINGIVDFIQDPLIKHGLYLITATDLMWCDTREKTPASMQLDKDSPYLTYTSEEIYGDDTSFIKFQIKPKSPQLNKIPIRYKVTITIGSKTYWLVDNELTLIKPDNEFQECLASTNLVSGFVPVDFAFSDTDIYKDSYTVKIEAVLKPSISDKREFTEIYQRTHNPLRLDVTWSIVHQVSNPIKIELHGPQKNLSLRTSDKRYIVKTIPSNCYKGIETDGKYIADKNIFDRNFNKYNEIDQWGDLIGLQRFAEESTYNFIERIKFKSNNPVNSSQLGLYNAAINEGNVERKVAVNISNTNKRIDISGGYLYVDNSSPIDLMDPATSKNTVLDITGGIEINDFSPSKLMPMSNLNTYSKWVKVDLDYRFSLPIKYDETLYDVYNGSTPVNKNELKLDSRPNGDIAYITYRTISKNVPMYCSDLLICGAQDRLERGKDSKLGNTLLNISNENYPKMWS